MGQVKGFLKYERAKAAYRPVDERVRDYAEFELPLTPDAIYRQAARCMDCGIPFCHGVGCPLESCIPDINELIYTNRWRDACDQLHSANNFPEITGRVCPAPCEAACTLSINDEPVTIRQIECQIVERGFAEGWIRPRVAEHKTNKRIAVIGSGPAGLAAAQQLARAGHDVVVFEKDERIGGLLRYGIPDFKLEKHIIDRRLKQLAAEGVEFQTGVNAGEDKSAGELVGEGLPAEIVCKVIRMVDCNEYKRRQSPPGVRITPKAFGKDRRMPITNGYSRFLFSYLTSYRINPTNAATKNRTLKKASIPQ